MKKVEDLGALSKSHEVITKKNITPMSKISYVNDILAFFRNLTQKQTTSLILQNKILMSSWIIQLCLT